MVAPEAPLPGGLSTAEKFSLSRTAQSGWKPNHEASDPRGFHQRAAAYTRMIAKYLAYIFLAKSAVLKTASKKSRRTESLLSTEKEPEVEPKI